MGTSETEVRLLKCNRKGIIIRKKASDYEIKEKCNDLKLIYKYRYSMKHDTHIVCSCEIHKDKGDLDITWSHLKNAKYGCKYCAGKGKDISDYYDKIDMLKVEILSDYIGYEKKIKCRCKTCGFEFETMPKTLIQGKYYCPECSKTQRGISRRTNPEIYKKKVYKDNPDILLLESYTRSKDKIKCRCKKCGHEWSSCASNILSEHIRCPACSSSKSEDQLAGILASLNLNYERKVRFKECRYKKPLEFDFIIYDNNKNITFACEYDGEQHYMPIQYTSKQTAESHLEITQIRDKIKNEYCKSNDIIMIRIPYWEKNNMESFLIKKLKENKLDYILTETVTTTGCLQ